MRNRKTKVILWISLIIAGLAVFFYTQNNLVGITNLEVFSSKITHPVRIVHLSDLHGKEFGHNNAGLIKLVNAQAPDLIVFTGDLIDRNGKNIIGSVHTLKELNSQFPVYYIPGNHEHWSGQAENLFQMLQEAGVKVLICGDEDMKVQGNVISILGLDETAFDSQTIDSRLEEFEKAEGYKILLSHYPENFASKYNRRDVDLVLSGHAHGGQFIIPFKGGLYAPGQGFFPKYYKGMYTENGVHLIVSRGLGNSVIPVRLFNRPEVVVITLQPGMK